MTISVDTIINDDRWNALDVDIQNIIVKSRKQLGLKEDANFSILFTADEEIKGFNATYRDKDKPTNVLSFPCEDIEGYVGDIILSYETVKAECKDQNKSFLDHSTHMIVHGFLHLLGFDHIEDDEAEEMEAHEVKILASLNIKNPYDV